MNKLSQYFSGLGFLAKGISLFRSHPSLITFAVIPFILDILGFIIGVYLGSSFLSGWVAAALAWIITPAAGIWYQILYYPLLFILWLVFLIVLGYFVVLVGSIIASPFHSLLAERSLMKFGLLQSADFSFGQWIKTSAKMFLVSILKASIFAILGIIVLIFSFIPILNVVGSFIACLLVAFDTMDYSFEAKEWNIKNRIQFFKSELPLFSGMATVLGLTLLIPGLTLLFYPVAIVGAAYQMAHSKKLLEGS